MLSLFHRQFVILSLLVDACSPGLVCSPQMFAVSRWQLARVLTGSALSCSLAWFVSPLHVRPTSSSPLESTSDSCPVLPWSYALSPLRSLHLTPHLDHSTPTLFLRCLSDPFNLGAIFSAPLWLCRLLPTPRSLASTADASYCKCVIDPCVMSC
jgi:hypothetical protein